MAKQQLYINGKAVDMPQDEIKIKVASNILSDADKVMTAHSYNVALPRTMTNDAIFALAYVAGADTGGKTTHKYLTASLYVDGVPLFDEGQAVLTSVDDKGYNLTLLWGIIGVFDEIKREGLKLNELPLSEHWNESTMAQWITLQRLNNFLAANPYNSGMDPDIYATLDSDSKALADRLPWWMPAVSATDILTKIANVYGLPITYSPRATARLQTLHHITTTRNTMAKGEQVSGIIRSILTPIGNNKYYIVWGMGASPTHQQIFDNAMRYSDGVWMAKHATHFKSITIFGGRANDDFVMTFPKAPDNVVQLEPTYNAEMGLYAINYTWYDVQLDEGDAMPFFNVHHDGVPYASTSFTLSYTIDEVAECEIGDNWEYTRNYPDLKVLDYISECLAHIGGFIVGSVTKAESINIVTFDEVAQAVAQNADTYGVESIEMALDDLARENRYTHAENKDDEAQGMQPYLAEGIIRTNDVTLTLERDAFKSDFKVPRVNKVPHWEVEKNEGANTYKATWHDAGRYILGTDITEHFYYNSGQDFERTITNYYGEYAKATARPKVLEVIVRLQVLELMAVDFTHPIYITQLGRNYLIVSIESDQGEQYKLKLIQL